MGCPAPFPYVTWRTPHSRSSQGLPGLLLREARNILRHRGLNWVLLIVLVLNLIAAAMVLEFEGGNPEATIASYPDALWWALTTITTVGYGDRFPMSSPGRAVAVVLMIAGIAMFGVITATIAAYFVEQQAEEDVAGPAGPDHGAAGPYRSRAAARRGPARP
jgi:voltage-gated potassium channel